ncbi:transposase [Holdemanella biformis]|uniref:IS1634 family transposase n=1 Tax=Holdemanella biformis TaxID=1735 RepID=UPI0022E098D8|nr:transposase [Holdemanella biformis]
MDKNIRDDTQISRLLKYNIKEQDINLFLRAWNQMNNTKECIYVGYDSTNFNTNAYGIELADYGHPKVDEGLPQYNLAYAVNQKDSTPLFYELYDGSVIDNTELEIMLEEAKEYGHEKLGVLMDRGYISEKNIKALRTKGYEYILMMKQNQRICQEITEEYGAAVQSLEGYYIGEHGVYGTTVKKQLYGQETNIHVYYDDIRASEEKVALMSRYETWEKEIEKKVAKRIATEGEMKKYRKVFKLKYDQNGYLVAYQRNSRYIKEEIRNLGFFFIITSEEMSASKALDIYRGESLKSKVFVTFIAMIVRNELFQKAEELRKKNRKAYTVPGMISELENIECTRNSVGKYRRKYALTAKQKMILKQFDMDEKYIDRSIGEFSY